MKLGLERESDGEESRDLFSTRNLFVFVRQYRRLALVNIVALARTTAMEDGREFR